MLKHGGRKASKFLTSRLRRDPACSTTSRNLNSELLWNEVRAIYSQCPLFIPTPSPTDRVCNCPSKCIWPDQNAAGWSAFSNYWYVTVLSLTSGLYLDLTWDQDWPSA